MKTIEISKKALIISTLILVFSSIITSVFLLTINIKPLFKSTNGFSVKYDIKK